MKRWCDDDDDGVMVRRRWFCLFVCMVFIVLLEKFSLISRRHHCRWRATNFDPWSLSSEGSLTCHTYCDTGLPFMMVIPEDPWYSHLLPSVWQWSCHYLFLRLRFTATGDRTPISRIRGERLTSTPPRRRRQRWIDALSHHRYRVFAPYNVTVITL